MPRRSPHRPIFDPKVSYGSVHTGTMVGSEPSIPATVSPGTVTIQAQVLAPTAAAASINPFSSTQSTGSGTSQVVVGIPSGSVTGDVMVLICRKNTAWGTLPSGFTEKHDNPYGIGQDISVVTGVYDSGVHGTGNLTFPYSGGTGLTRAILYAVSGVSADTAGFNSADDINGNDQFYPTLTTPGGLVVGFAFAFSSGDFTDEQHNGWTRDWDDTTTNSYTKYISSSGAQTMPRFDNVSNAYLVTFYAPAV